MTAKNQVFTNMKEEHATRASLQSHLSGRIHPNLPSLSTSSPPVPVCTDCIVDPSPSPEEMRYKNEIKEIAFSRTWNVDWKVLFSQTVRLAFWTNLREV